MWQVKILKKLEVICFIQGDLWSLIANKLDF